MLLSAIFSIFLSLSKVLFFPLLVIRVYIGLSSIRVIYCWLRLELNILRILPLIVLSDSFSSAATGLKYFLIQAWGSRVFLFRVLVGLGGGRLMLAARVSLALKLGAAPFHLWFIRVLRKTGYEVLVLLSTIQKILPLYLLSLIPRIGVKIWLSGIRALVGAWGVYRSRGLAVILGFSSVFLRSWLLAGSFVRVESWVIYLALYRAGLVGMVSILQRYRVVTISQLQGGVIKGEQEWEFYVFLFFLAGLPPFPTFWAKLNILRGLLGSRIGGLVRVLLVGSVWVIYLYVRVGLFIITLNHAWRLRSRFTLQSGYTRVIVLLSLRLSVWIILL